MRWKKDESCGKISQRARAAIAISRVQVACERRQIFGQNRVIKVKSVYAVVSVSPMSSVFRIPETDTAKMYVKTLSTNTEILEIIFSRLSSRSGAMNLLIKSPTTNVVLPISRAEAVETSAAQSPARTIPATKGLRLKTVRGKASVGTIPG